MGFPGPVLSVAPERDRVTGDFVGYGTSREAGTFKGSVVENSRWCGESWQL